VVPHVHFELLQLVRQQEAMRHEVVLALEETLQSRDDYTKDVFLCEVIHEWVAVDHTRLIF